MKLERRAMEKKVAYIEHFLTMSEDEKKVRNDLKSGKRKKKKGEDPDADFVEEEHAGAVLQPLPPPTQRTPSALPLPRVLSQTLPSVQEPTPEAARVSPSAPPIPAAEDDAANTDAPPT